MSGRGDSRFFWHRTRGLSRALSPRPDRPRRRRRGKFTAAAKEDRLPHLNFTGEAAGGSVDRHRQAGEKTILSLFAAPVSVSRVQTDATALGGVFRQHFPQEILLLAFATGHSGYLLKPPSKYLPQMSQLVVWVLPFHTATSDEATHEGGKRNPHLHKILRSCRWRSGRRRQKPPLSALPRPTVHVSLSRGNSSVVGRLN